LRPDAQRTGLRESAMSSDDLDQGTNVDAEAEDGPAAAGGILQKLRDLSVRSKFLIMMLLTSLLSLGAVSLIGYKSGRDALVSEINNKLTSLRSSKKQQIEWYFENMRDTMLVLGENNFVRQAFLSFRGSYKDLLNTPASKLQLEKLRRYYSGQFIPRMEKSTGETAHVDDYWPRSELAQSLQAYMIAENPHKVGEKDKLLQPEAFINYGLTHEPFHRWFRAVAKKHKFYDVFLIDGTSDKITYSVFKEVDFGTSLSNGPFSQSNLARLYRRIKAAPKAGQVEMIDYEPYAPSYNQPASFIATPVFFGRKFVGVLAAQISIDAINDFMTNNRQWKAQGLGDSGEIYIVGRDKRMRSNSRFIIEDDKKFAEDLKRYKVRDETIASIVAKRTTVLSLSVDSAAVRAALRGDSGTDVVQDYRGIPVLSSYTPLDVEGMRWVLLAEIDEAEALKPQQEFQRLLTIVACGLTLLVTLGSLLLSNFFLKPLNALIDGIGQLREGKTDVHIEKTSGDEFGQLTEAFNAMSSEIRTRDETIEGKSRAYETLLKRIFPDAIADKLRQGKGNFVDSFPQVSTIYVIVSGLDQVAADTDGQTSFDLLNEVVEMFDAEAEKLGVEKVKTIGEHYLATCGLTVPRLDHARLAMQFVENIAGGIRRHNLNNDTKLTIRAGIHSGLVHAGIVGNRKFVYDVWGPCVNIARRIVYEANLGSLQMTEEAIAQLGDTGGFDPTHVVKTWTMGEVHMRQKKLDVGISSDDVFHVPDTPAAAAE
ncbi:MAG: adenylate/guanylate cyclase domain-containing protein, partial [Hyphomicrobiaceae bacterium]